MVNRLSKVASVFIAVLFLAGPATFAQTKTKINDPAAAKMLLGKHKISLQWISWDYFGSANVTQALGAYGINGQQKGRGNSDFLTIDGYIESIDAKQFILDGKIVTKVSYINGGKPCERRGQFTFKITGKRRYWRLQEMNNPCDEAADYVDLYLR